MLKKDLSELYLLQLLNAGDKYGYELLEPLRTVFPDTRESTVYALLRGLCKEAYTQWYMAPSSGGPDRKYYKITPAGQTRLEELWEEWQRLSRAINEFGAQEQRMSKAMQEFEEK